MLLSNALELFRQNVAADTMSDIESVLSPLQMQAFLLMVNGSGVGPGIALLNSLDENQLNRIRGMVPQNVLCLWVFIINMDIARWEILQGAPPLMAFRGFMERLASPIAPKMRLLNPGGCSGRVFNNLFLASGIRSPFSFGPYLTSLEYLNEQL